MEAEDKEERCIRSRSFRDEGYSVSRRVFLYSYPLHWGGEDEDYEGSKEGTETSSSDGSEGKKQMKELVIAVFRWGEGKALILRRFKHKLRVYIIACLPIVGLKHKMG